MEILALSKSKEEEIHARELYLPLAFK